MSLQGKHKELFTVSKKEQLKTSFSYVTEPGTTNKQPTWKKENTLLMGDWTFSGLREWI